MVPVRWIGRIGTGTAGALTLSGAPGEVMKVTLDQAEQVVRTGEHGEPGDRFLVSGRLDRVPGTARAGMRGVVRLNVDEAPVIVTWTRGIADAVRAWGWW